MKLFTSNQTPSDNSQSATGTVAIADHAETWMIGRAMMGPHALALGERLQELFAAAGLNPTDAARASYLLFGYMFGSVALEVAYLDEPGPPSKIADRIAARRQGFAAAPADRFPRIAASADTMAEFISGEQYLWGLHRLLDGISAGDSTDSGRKSAAPQTP